jgi:hypothetical protein
MEIVIFEGALSLGDSANATMVFAQDFRVMQCAAGERKLTIECRDIQILGPEEHQEISSHAVYLDHCMVGRLKHDRTELTILPDVEAGVHRLAIHVSTFPGLGLCDDFTLRRVVFSCKD